MVKLLFVLILLLPVAALFITGETSMPLIRAIDLNADMLLKRPELATADTLALLVETNRGAYYKLSERDKILTTGKLLPGSNSLLFSRPGLFTGNQSLFLLFDLLENGVNFQKKINITMTIIEETAITVIEETAIELQKKKRLSGTFALGMYHAGHQIGFRKKVWLIT